MPAQPITLDTYPLATGYSIDPASFVEVIYSNGRQPAYDKTTVEAIAKNIESRSREFSDDGRSVCGQIIVETNYLRFIGDVHPGQYNFGGIGATGAGARGEIYTVTRNNGDGTVSVDVPASVDAGVLAMFAHRSIYMRGEREKWPAELRDYHNASHRYFAVVSAGKAGVVHQQKDFGSGNWAVDPEYNKKITAAANLVRADGGSMAQLKLAIGAGHRNYDGGNADERRMTATLCKAYVDTGRKLGVDVRCYTPNDGLGEYPGNLHAAIQNVNTWASQGWVADMYIEVHYQGLSEGSNAGRGAFVVYPDWPQVNDVDTDARDKFRPLWAAEITSRTGLPLFGNGGMSEGRTGVGASGSRLGVFSVTVGLKASTTRMIIEHGCHTSPLDKAIIVSPGFDQKCADAFYAAWFKMIGASPPPENGYVPSGPGASVDGWNGHTFYVIGPFYQEVQRLGNEFAPVYGLVASGMFIAPVDGVDRYVQLTENGCMACYPQGLPHGVPEGDPWFIRNLTPARRQAVLEYGKATGVVYSELT